jgi:hypothetical protein
MTQQGITFMGRRIMKTLHRITIASVLAIAMLAAPVATLAGEQGSGNSGRHHLIDHQRIQALKEKVADLRERLKDHRQHQPGGSGNGGSNSGNLETQMADLQNKVTALTTSNASLLTQLQAAANEIGLLQGRVTTLEANPGGGGGGSLASLAKYVTVDPNPINGVKGPHVIFTGVNVHIRSGSGSTEDRNQNGISTPTGLGNLIIGYNEGPVSSGTSSGLDFMGAGRTGSHNLVGGVRNAFTSVGGFVFGQGNWIAREYAAVSGGLNNIAGNTITGGVASHVLGGTGNQALFDNSLAP